MKNYTIDNNEMTISANWEKLSPTEKQTVKEFIDLGYKFEQKLAKKRNGANRKREYFTRELINEDMAIFNAIASEKAINKKGEIVVAKGAYGHAIAFGNTIIKLGKYTDRHEDEIGILDEYRKLSLQDLKKASMFASRILESETLDEVA